MHNAKQLAPPRKSSPDASLLRIAFLADYGCLHECDAPLLIHVNAAFKCTNLTCGREFPLSFARQPTYRMHKISVLLFLCESSLARQQQPWSAKFGRVCLESFSLTEHSEHFNRDTHMTYASENGPLPLLCKLATLQSSTDPKKSRTQTVLRETLGSHVKNQLRLLCCLRSSFFSAYYIHKNLVLLRLCPVCGKDLQMHTELSPVKKKTSFIVLGGELMRQGYLFLLYAILVFTFYQWPHLISFKLVLLYGRKLTV